MRNRQLLQHCKFNIECGKRPLFLREKAIVFTFLALFITFFFLAKKAQYQAGPFSFHSPHHFASSLHRIEIQGAVAKPGYYSIRPETPVSAVLKRARPLLDADLTHIDLNRRCKEISLLDVPAVKEFLISVREEGKTEKFFSFPIGTRVCELRKKMVWDREADLSSLKSQRKIKHREIFEIPRKRLAPLNRRKKLS